LQLLRRAPDIMVRLCGSPAQHGVRRLLRSADETLRGRAMNVVAHACALCGNKESLVTERVSNDRIAIHCLKCGYVWSAARPEQQPVSPSPSSAL
jgi:hypothetical protein